VFRAKVVSTPQPFVGEVEWGELAFQKSGDRNTGCIILDALSPELSHETLGIRPDCNHRHDSSRLQRARKQTRQDETWYEQALRHLNPNNIDYGSMWEQRKQAILKRIGNPYFQ
jgi:hypothetical protein